MSGGPSQLDLFDYKPKLAEMNGQDLPESIRAGQRLTGMTGFQARLPLAGSVFDFAQHGKSGAWVSELMPWTAKMVDELCFIRSLHTEHINHDPAITFFQTGHQLAGRPSMGAWLSYGLGSANENLPAFVVLISEGSHRSAAVCAALGKWLSAQRASRGAVPQRRRSGALSAESRRRQQREPASNAGSAGRASHCAVSGYRRSRDQLTRGAIRDGLPHADQRA
jgi:hypothetical protein